MLSLSAITQDLFLHQPLKRYTPRQNRTRAYRKFVKQVLNRDNHTCRNCGAKGSANNILSVHHILHCSTHPWLMFNEENCVTLCKDTCHTKFDKMSPDEQKQKLGGY